MSGPEATHSPRKNYTEQKDPSEVVWGTTVPHSHTTETTETRAEKIPAPQPVRASARQTGRRAGAARAEGTVEKKVDTAGIIRQLADALASGGESAEEMFKAIQKYSTMYQKAREDHPGQPFPAVTIGKDMAEEVPEGRPEEMPQGKPEAEELPSSRNLPETTAQPPTVIQEMLDAQFKKTQQQFQEWTEHLKSKTLNAMMQQRQQPASVQQLQPQPVDEQQIDIARRISNVTQTASARQPDTSQPSEPQSGMPLAPHVPASVAYQQWAALLPSHSAVQPQMPMRGSQLPMPPGFQFPAMNNSGFGYGPFMSNGVVGLLNQQPFASPIADADVDSKEAALCLLAIERGEELHDPRGQNGCLTHPHATRKRGRPAKPSVERERDPATKKQPRVKSCKYIGVRKRKWGTYASEIRNPISGSREWLGTFETPEEAAVVYDIRLRMIRGPDAARVNFPPLEPHEVTLTRVICPHGVSRPEREHVEIPFDWMNQVLRIKADQGTLEPDELEMVKSNASLGLAMLDTGVLKTEEMLKQEEHDL